MSKHKVARKVASSRGAYDDRIELEDWLEEAHPEVFKQFQAIRDIERSVQPAYDDVEYHQQVREEFMQVYKEWKGRQVK